MTNVILLEEPGILKISYEADESLLIHEWFDYNPEGRDPLIFELLERIFGFFLKYPAEKVLVKADQVRGVYSPEVQSFIREVQFPRILAQTQIHYVATVKSDEFLRRIGTDVWSGQLTQQSQLTIREFASEAEARKWLQGLAPRSTPES